MIEVKHNQQANNFEVLFDENHAGYMYYQWESEEVFAITHTEVDEAFAGKGLGKNMVLAAVDFARENNFKILPLCPFAKKVLTRTSDYDDVLVRF